MHDPLTVAFEIKSPFRGRPSKFWPKDYRKSLATIWHCDPEYHSRHMCLRRQDDTCGWFSPPYTVDARDRIQKLGRDQYSTIFNKQWAEGAGKDYARICYVPTPYDAIYWAWRAIKHAEQKGRGWQYGKALSAAELNHIYSLDASPVDNLRLTVASVTDADSCADLFLMVYQSYLRFSRPWYRHPRWHVWHWRIQIHAVQAFKRWAFSRCATCGKRFAWGYSPTTHTWDNGGPHWFRGEGDVHHSHCLGIANTMDGSRVS